MCDEPWIRIDHGPDDDSAEVQVRASRFTARSDESELLPAQADVTGADNGADNDPSCRWAQRSNREA